MGRMMTMSDYDYKTVGSLNDEEFKEHERWKAERAEKRRLDKIAEESRKNSKPRVILRRAVADTN